MFLTATYTCVCHKYFSNLLKLCDHVVILAIYNIFLQIFWIILKQIGIVFQFENDLDLIKTEH